MATTPCLPPPLVPPPLHHGHASEHSSLNDTAAPKEVLTLLGFVWDMWSRHKGMLHAMAGQEGMISEEEAEVMRHLGYDLVGLSSKLSAKMMRVVMKEDEQGPNIHHDKMGVDDNMKVSHML